MRTSLAFSIALVGLLLIGCKREEVNTEPQTEQVSKTVGIERNRLVFQSSSHFFEVVRNPEAVNEVFEKFEGNGGFLSLFNKAQQVNAGAPADAFQKDLIATEFPQDYQKLLNEHGEIQIGDTLVWYSKGKKHLVAGLNEARLSKIKADPSLSDLTGEYSIRTIQRDATAPNGRIIINNGGNARPVYTFWQNVPVSGTRRFVHELRALTETQLYIYHVTYLWISVRHERLNGSSWVATTNEPRYVYCVVSGTYTIQYQTPGSTTPASAPNTPFSINSSLQATTSNCDFTIGAYSVRSPSRPSWDIEFSGSISQQVNGDSHPFSDAGWPLW